jgi:hypothetical protein
MATKFCNDERRGAENARIAARRLYCHPLAAALAAAFALCAPLAERADAAQFPSAATLAASGVMSAAARGDPPKRGGAEPATTTPAPVGDGNAIVVANCNDSGPGSLRDAVASAGDGGNVDLTTLACSTITLTSGAIVVAGYGVTVFGPGASALTIDGNNSDRVIDHLGNGSLNISGLAVAHGVGEGDGGCLHSNGTLRLFYSAVHDCVAQASGAARGGGVYARDYLHMGYSSIVGNAVESGTGYARGGGIYVRYEITMSASTISGNSAVSNASDSDGGGIFAGGNAQVYYSTISNNQAELGGGVVLTSGGAAVARIVDSTISNNVATQSIGGVFSDAYLELRNSTIAFNCATVTSNIIYIVGIGLQFRDHPPEMQSSIIANNTLCVARDVSAAPEDVPYDVSGGLYDGSVTGANNLIVTAAVVLPADTLHSDPLLNPLAYNGGPTRTLSISATSPAIDAGNNVAGVDFDQRGMSFARSMGLAPDIGAYELNTDIIFIGGFE